MAVNRYNKKMITLNQEKLGLGFFIYRKVFSHRPLELKGPIHRRTLN